MMRVVWRSEFTLYAIALLVLALVAASHRSVSSQAGYMMGISGAGFDALTAQEQATVLSTTLAALADQSPVRAAMATPQELLLIERHQEPKEVYERGDWPRRGDAYIYDYGSDTLTFALINLDTGQVDAIEAYQGVQLPLTDNEIGRALDIAYADESLRTVLAQQFQAITGQPLLGLSQLNVKAFVFRAASMPENLNEYTQRCGLHRCAQLLLFTNEDIAFEVQPIIDLSTGQVVQLLGQ